MKKIVSLVVTAALIISQTTATSVYANDVAKDSSNPTGTTSTSSSLLDKYKSESELFGTTYEEVKKPIPRSIAANTEERQEFVLDRGGLATVTSLKTLTSANYEVILSYADKNTFVTTADTFNLAVLKAQELVSSAGTNVIPAVIEKTSGQIVYATEAMGRVIKVIDGQIYLPADKNTNVYSSSYLTQAYTYVNHGYVDDVPVLEDNGTSAKVEVSGYTGWLSKDTKKSEYDLMVVPVNKALNPSYYISENGELNHSISYDLLTNGGRSYKIKIGVAPSFMTPGVKYYSYDGNYFYTNLRALISDGKAGHHNNAVNANKPFYNYYQYLPFRSKTTFSADQINNYLENRANLAANSKLRGIGQALINAESISGVNALITFGVASNESASGTSSISQQKNNIFGINAVDSNPAGSANAFATVEDCIKDFTKNYISRDYSDPDDWKYYGGYLGNKNLGANVKYASDPFWGEKAAQYMYKMDYHTSNFVVNNYGDNASISNLRELDNYQLGIHTKIKDVLTAPKTGSTKLYPVAQNLTTGSARVGNVFVVKNTNVFRDGSTSYYNITPVRTTVGYNYGGRFDGTFDWSKEAYVEADGVMLINTATPLKKGWVLENNLWYFYDEATGKKKTGWLLDNNRWYYLDSNGAMKTGWLLLDNKWYLLNIYGARETGLKVVGDFTYYFNTDGIMETGLEKINGKTYYFTDSGRMATGLTTLNGKKYYFNNNGVLTTGWVLINKNWYFFNTDGTMKTGWLYTGGYWYYLQDNGIMKTGWLLLGNTWYYLEGGGAMKTGWLKLGSYWYYLDGGGAMKTGWVFINGYWYYFYAGGNMAYSTTIDGYRLSSGGARI